MSRFTLVVLAVLLGVAAVPSAAQARSDIEISFGFGGGHPYYPEHHRHHERYERYGHGRDHFAPPVFYAPPVTYIQPRRVIVSAPIYAYPSSSPVFIDQYGRTCRNFQTVDNYSTVSGTACLQPDGSWRTVGY